MHLRACLMPLPPSVGPAAARDRQDTARVTSVVDGPLAIMKRAD